MWSSMGAALLGAAVALAIFVGGLIADGWIRRSAARRAREQTSRDRTEAVALSIYQAALDVGKEVRGYKSLAVFTKELARTVARGMVDLDPDDALTSAIESCA